MTSRLAICVVLLAASIARAQEDPDTQAARRHFARGQQLYEQEKYDDAVLEFQTAKELRPIPAFDYNIGRCYDRLERWDEAADAYERYLAAEPHAHGGMEIQERIAILRGRSKNPSEPKPPGRQNEAPLIAPPPPPGASLVVGAPPAKRPVYKRAWFWGVVGGGAVAVAVGVALGVTLGGGGADPSHPIMDVRF